jgi:tetratricopeptide (TPR) repeat protein
MRKKIYLLAIVSILVLSVYMAAKQLIADSYCSMAHHDGKDPNKAIGYLEKSVAIDSRRPLFHVSLGRVYLRKGLAEAAKQGEKNKWVRKSIDEFHKAIELEPSNSDYHFHLGNSYTCLAYPPPFYWEVIQNSFERTTMLNPTQVRHLYSIGIHYLNEFNRLKSILDTTDETGSAHYKDYVAMSKDSYGFYFRKLLGVNEDYLGEILEKSFSATQKYSDLKSIIRDNSHDHAFFARFLRSKGMWEEAKAEYRKAIDLDPTNPDHYCDFGYGFFLRGDFRKAIYWWQKQKIVDPGDRRAYLFLVNCFVKLKRFDDALQEVRDLITLYPRNINYQLKLIRTLLAAGRVDEAVNEYHELTEENPHLSRRSLDAISHYKNQGDYRKVTKILNEALSRVLTR